MLEQAPCIPASTAFLSDSFLEGCPSESHQLLSSFPPTTGLEGVLSKLPANRAVFGPLLCYVSLTLELALVDGWRVTSLLYYKIQNIHVYKLEMATHQ